MKKDSLTRDRLLLRYDDITNIYHGGLSRSEAQGSNQLRMSLVMLLRRRPELVTLRKTLS